MEQGEFQIGGTAIEKESANNKQSAKLILITAELRTIIQGEVR